MNSDYYAVCIRPTSWTDTLNVIPPNLESTSAIKLRLEYRALGSILTTTDNSSLTTLDQDANRYVVHSGTHLNTSQDILKRNGNDLRIAIEGVGYAPIYASNGTAYPHKVNLLVSSQVQLATAPSNLLVEENEPLTTIDTPFSVCIEKVISADRLTTELLKPVGFASNVDLCNFGSSYCLTLDGAAKIATASQRAIGSSNPSPVTSGAELVTAQREVVTTRRVLPIYSDLDSRGQQCKNCRALAKVSVSDSRSRW